MELILQAHAAPAAAGEEKKMKKRIISMLMVLCLTLTLLPTGAFALDTSASSVPRQGDKFLKPVAAIPDVAGWIAVSDYDGLCKIGKDAAYPITGKYYLTADIAIPSGAEWTPISGFKGVFDGQGYFISGLTLEPTQNMSDFSAFGVFGSADHAEIRNLGVKDIDINAGDVIATRQGDLAIGGVVGYAKASVIDNCYASGSISRVYGSFYISDMNPNGGICGRASYDYTDDQRAKLANCRSEVNICALETAGDMKTPTGISGGVAGICDETDIENCVCGKGSSAGAEDGIFSGAAGGIVGIGDESTMTGCINEKNISGGGDNTGGIAGKWQSTLESCTNNGAVSVLGGGCTGGIVGYLERPDDQASQNPVDGASVNKCVNNGDVTSRSDTSCAPAGGIVGLCLNPNASFTDCENHGKVDLRENFVCPEGETYNSLEKKAGGIVGYIYVNTTFLRCKNTGDVTAYSDGCDHNGVSRIMVGGIIGYTGSGESTMKDCINRGNIYGEAYNAEGSVFAGGIIGWESGDAMSMEQSTNYGNVTALSKYDHVKYPKDNPAVDYPANTYAGGVCGLGYNHYATITNCGAPNVAVTSYIDNDGGADSLRNAKSHPVACGDPTLIGCGTMTATFKDGDITDVTFPWAPSYLANCTTTDYNNSIAIASLILSAAAEQSDNFERVLSVMKQLELVTADTSLSKTGAYFYDGYDGEDLSVGYSLGFRSIKLGGQSFHLITVVAKGTTSLGDGLIDVLPWAFEINAKGIITELKDFVERNGGSLTDANNRFLIVGHSLGGATANLIAQDLIHDEKCQKENIHGYTFASPLTVSGHDEGAEANVNIHNVVNKDDYVPKLSPKQMLGLILTPAALKAAAIAMMGADMTRYGKDRTWDTSTKSFRRTYQQFTGSVWPAEPDPITLHVTKTYMSHLLQDEEYEITQGESGRMLIVSCPVDVEVLNKSGTVVASAIGGKATDNLADGVAIAVSGDIKYVYITDGGDYSLRLTATGSGTMTVAVQDVTQNSAGSDESVSKTFTDVVLTSGKLMASDVSGSVATGAVKLYTAAGNGKALSEISESGAETAVPESEVKTFAGWNGTDTGSGTDTGTGGSGGTGTGDSGTNTGGNDSAVSPVKPETTQARPSAVFTDVAAAAWYRESVDYVLENAIMTGTSATTFSPEVTMSRAMLVTVLWRIAGKPVVNYAMSFADVPADAYYTEAVRWAAVNKLVDGYSNDSFGPNDSVTREQLAAILYRYAKYKGYDVSVGADANILSYKDALSVSEYAVPAIQWACGAGLLQGSGGNLLPQNRATRAQAAAILQRFAQNIVK